MFHAAVTTPCVKYSYIGKSFLHAALHVAVKTQAVWFITVTLQSSGTVPTGDINTVISLSVSDVRFSSCGVYTTQTVA